MESATTEFLIIFGATYLLTALTLLAYKAALNDLNVSNLNKTWWEVKSVHPVALLSSFVALVPLALVRGAVDTKSTTYGLIALSAGYFISTLIFRKHKGLKVVDFSVDTGSSFNDEISADPTPAQRLWLFMVSWAGAVVMGVTFGLIAGYNSWKDQTNWLSDKPGEFESRVYLIIFGSVIVLSTLLFARLRSKRLRRLPTANRIRIAINRSWFLPSLFGLLFALLQDFTRNTTLTNRYFTVIIFVWIGLVQLWNSIFVVPTAKKFLTEDKKFFEAQQKRIKKARNKKRKKNRR